MLGLAANGRIGYNRQSWFGRFELEHDEDTLNNRRKFMKGAATASIAIGFCHGDSIPQLYGRPVQPEPAQPEPTIQAWVNATLLPVDLPQVSDGVLVTSGGKIIAVGSKADVKIPVNLGVVGSEGMVVMPGLGRYHSHLGWFVGGVYNGPFPAVCLGLV